MFFLSFIQMLALLPTIVYSQFSFSAITGFSSVTYSFPCGLSYSQTRDSGTNAYFNIKDSTGKFKIIHWDLSNSSNYVNAGNYSLATQSSQYQNTYFLNNFILANANTGRAKVFNKSSYAYIGSLNNSIIINRGQFISSLNVFVYGTYSGSIGYFNINTLPNVNIISFTSPFLSVVYVKVSPDQAYVAFSSINSSQILFYRTSNWTLVSQATANTAGVYTHAWSVDSRYCYSSLYNQGKIEVYDRDANFAKIYTITTNQLYVRAMFLYPQTNVIVGVNQNTNSLFTVNLDHNITNHYLYNFSNQYLKMYTYDQTKSFSVVDGLQTAWFFKISPFCNIRTIYNRTTMNCDACPSNCSICSTTTYCTSCDISFNNANGSCIQCFGATYFNRTNLACSSCSNNCASCLNSTNCTNCNANFNYANGVCIQCTGATYFNSTNLVCDSCQINCFACNNSTFCTTCNANFNNANGVCIQCTGATYFNATNLVCDSCQINCFACNNSTFCTTCNANFNNANGVCIQCTGATYFNATNLVCDSCPINCFACNNSTYCTTCNANFNNANGVCIQCTGATYFNATNLVCDSCPNNCFVCNSLTTCTTCSSGYNLSGNICIICFINEYFNSTTLSCQSCPNNCAICNNSSFCLNCETNFSNAGGVCTLCQSNQYFNTSLLSCQSCQTSCSQCSSLFSCLTCENNFILVNGACQLESVYNEEDQLFQYVISETLQNSIVKLINVIPGSRRIFHRIFRFFINLDHFQLYIYHKRQYGNYFNSTLYAIKNLQDSKWNMISSQTLAKAFSFNISNLQNEFTSKTNFTSWKFMKVEKNQISFFGNTLNYFFLNVPLVLAMFFLMRFLFKLFFKFEISLLFRQYSFYAYLVLMFVEGNIEQFSYLFISELLIFFNFSFKDKISQILMIGFFFFFICTIIGNYLMFKSTFNKLAKYFYDNCDTVIFGTIYLTTTNGVFNFCLGAAHRIFQDSYQLQLLSLGIIQTCYILFIISSLKKFKIFELYYIQWANFVTSFLRILLLMTFYIDYNASGENEIIQQIQRNIIILYLSIWLMIIALNFGLLAIKLFIYIFKKIQQNQISFQQSKKDITIMRKLTQKTTKKPVLKIQFVLEKKQQTQLFGILTDEQLKQIYNTKASSLWKINQKKQKEIKIINNLRISQELKNQKNVIKFIQKKRRSQTLQGVENIINFQ